MSQPTVYLNASFLPRDQAHLDIDDRAALFADGVYEVVAFYNKTPLAMDAHLKRMRRSLSEIDIDPAAADDLENISQQLLEKNHLDHAFVYWQISRGVAPRDHIAPQTLTPTVLATCRPTPPPDPDAPIASITADLQPDQRWGRCDIKSLMLLPNVLAMNRARRNGFDEVVLHRDNIVTECARTSLFMIKNGHIHTHPADTTILGGITRHILIDLAPTLDIPVHETPFDTQALLQADEALVCGTGSKILALTRIGKTPIADGTPGPITEKLAATYRRWIIDTCNLQ